MPPINQGARGTMISWLVGTTVAAVAAIICAIYFYVESNRVAQESDNLTRKYHDVVAEAALTGSDIADLKAKRDDTANGYNPRMSFLDVALKERDDMAARLAGPGATMDKAMTTSAKAIQAAAEKAKEAGIPAPPGDNLTAVTDTLTKALSTLQAQAADLTKQRDAAHKQVQDAAAQLAQARAAFEKGLADSRAQADKAGTDLSQDRAAKDDQLKKLTADAETAQKAAQEAQAQSQVTIADLTKKLNDADTRIRSLEDRLGAKRISTADAVVRQADGKIIRVPGGGTVYIDLGSGDQISPALTFEVYDRVEGVPALGDPTTDENLPRGKGSIEVIRVGPGSSECRIVKLQPGQNIVQGDLIENLVYDKHTKYNFVVFGNFDLDQNGVATPQDAEIVKRLVTQWGGKVMDKVNVDADFVVLGKEPVIPVLTKEEREDPLKVAQAAQATAEAEAYDKVKTDAKEYHIPILNQNRFLYFVGYYEMAQR
jgi:hypothetical protein